VVLLKGTEEVHADHCHDIAHDDLIGWHIFEKDHTKKNSHHVPKHALSVKAAPLSVQTTVTQLTLKSRTSSQEQQGTGLVGARLGQARS